MMFAQDTDDPETVEPPPRDVSDRMAARLDRQTEKAAPMKQAEPAIPATAEPVEEPAEAGAELF